MPNGSRAISGVATSIAAFIGWAPIGPTDRAQPVLSWADFERIYGGLDARSLLGYAVSHFFTNGGQQASIVRLADGAAALDGLPALDRIEQFNLLCVPGVSDPATLTRLQTYCREHRAFLIADCAAGDTFATLREGPHASADDAGMNAAFYFPWVTMADPLQQNRPRDFPPSGAVAGIYARTDASRGVWKAPAGTQATVAGALGVKAALRDTELMTLDHVAVNCLRTLPGQGTAIWGARTMHGDDAHASEWKYIPVRRTALYIEQSLSEGLKWTAFEPNGEALWSGIRASVGDFLNVLFRQGALQGTTPREAFFVKCDRTTTTEDDIARGLITVVVGFAPLKPAEFVVLTLQQLTARLNPDA